ncbi:thiamine phosphate synthase [Deinococcus peraridilitoris]|uniref:Thiamine-phosphate synthase n=1 Tax=Deinococcus peraridilitoris (strain DSM 19664 / LMG 22246 / CIP 109416 / KR-200) TaxID=937777 RepID=K9ZW67_DEIPD|nr:thiamine phosphate synthase [Deinococcus peraridilitoris]AFZ65811.1 thiamine-phosphate pyrophosphorylase [Deinococcus peraridilitoris DSM 19664]
MSLGHLYLVATPTPGQGEADFLTRVEAALQGGVDVLQLRCKDWEALPYLQLAERMGELARRYHVPLFVNDRPDVAFAAGADGVHLGQNDLPPVWSRAVAPGLLIGRSTHAPGQAEAALTDRPAYLAVGPVHATPTKPGRSAVGLSYVRWAAKHLPQPWYAIGGIDLSNVEAVLAAGARRIAVVRAILDAPDPARAAHEFRQCLRARQPEAC